MFDAGVDWCLTLEPSSQNQRSLALLRGRGLDNLENASLGRLFELDQQNRLLFGLCQERRAQCGGGESHTLPRVLTLGIGRRRAARTPKWHEIGIGNFELRTCFGRPQLEFRSSEIGLHRPPNFGVGF